VEIHDGAPIFYGLGDLLYRTRTITKLPAEMYDRFDLGVDALPPDVYDELGSDDDGEPRGFNASREFREGVVPVCSFEGGEFDGIALYPIELGFEEPRSRRGRPVLADEEAAARIVGGLRELSEPYGTTVEFRDGIGRVPA